MTDNEIIVPLKCLVMNESDCRHCKLKDKNDKCQKFLYSDVLGLIEENNRQKAEIEALIAGQETLQRYISTAKAEAVKEFAERLKAKFSCMEYVIKTSRKTMPVERVKAEVDAVLQNGCLNIIDKILKEVTGDPNARNS